MHMHRKLKASQVLKNFLHTIPMVHFLLASYHYPFISTQVCSMFQPLLKADMLNKISLTCLLESSTSTFTTLLSSISWEIKSTNMPPHSSSRICRIRELFGGSLSLKADRMAVSIAFWFSSWFVPGTNDTGRVCCPNKTSTVIEQPAISVELIKSTRRVSVLEHMRKVQRISGGGQMRSIFRPLGKSMPV